MTYGFMLVGVGLVALLLTVEQLARFIMRDYTKSVYTGTKGQIRTQSRRSMVVFVLNLLIMGALVWWSLQFLTFTGVI
jgi:hypothetical protein